MNNNRDLWHNLLVASFFALLFLSGCSKERSTSVQRLVGQQATSSGSEASNASSTSSLVTTCTPSCPSSGGASDFWRPTSLDSAPSARYDHAAVWTGSEMIVWGGRNSSSTLKTGGRYNPRTDSWQHTSLENAPSPRTGHTAVWTDTEMIVWGGHNYDSEILEGVIPISGTEFNTGGRYNPATNTWTPISTRGAPSRRFDHVAVWTGEKMLVWGGTQMRFLPTEGIKNRHAAQNSGAAYDPVTDSWEPISSFNAPTATYPSAFVGNYINGKFFVLDTLTSFGGLYDNRLDTWQRTARLKPMYLAGGMTSVALGNEAAIFGAKALTCDRDSCIYQGVFPPRAARLFDVDRHQWSQTADAKVSRVFHSAVASNPFTMLVFGGAFVEREISLHSHLEKYDRVTNRWSSLSKVNAPTPRAEHTAVWIGCEMIVWGGNINAVHYGGYLQLQRDGSVRPADWASKVTRTGGIYVP